MQKFRILAPTHIFCEGSMENAWLWIHRSCWDECQIKEKNWHDWREGWPVGWCAAHQLFTACFNSNILQRRKVINWISIVSLTWFKFNCDFSERYIVWTCFQILAHYLHVCIDLVDAFWTILLSVYADTLMWEYNIFNAILASFCLFDSNSICHRLF